MNDTNPLVTIVMPTYNQAHFLKEALDSLVAQTYSHWECIVINNYSEDDTIYAVENYSDHRVRLVNYRNNGIIAASRNVGILQSKGEYIAFLDSDDMWLPFKLERQINCFRNNPNIGLVYSKCSVMKNNQIYRNAPRINLFRGYTFRKMIFVPVVPLLTAMIRKDIISNVGYFDEDPKLVAVEDAHFFLRVAKYCKLEYLEPALAIYRIHTNNSSSNPMKEFCRMIYMYSKCTKCGVISLPQLILIAMPGMFILFSNKIVRYAISLMLKK